jgi:gephyrin
MSTSILRAAVLVVSETASKDKATDKCIPILKDVFENVGNGQWEVAATEIVPDSVIDIQKAIQAWADCEDPINLIITSGGTGFAVKDVTPEVPTLYVLSQEINSLIAPPGSIPPHRSSSSWTCVSLQQ